MTVFIVFASGHVDVSVINCLCGLVSLDLIGYSRHVEDALVRILENKPNVVIIDSRNAESDASGVLRGIRDFALTPVRVVLTNLASIQNDQKVFMEEGIVRFQFPEEEKDMRLALAIVRELDRVVKEEHQKSLPG